MNKKYAFVAAGLLVGSAYAAVSSGGLPSMGDAGNQSPITLAASPSAPAPQQQAASPPPESFAIAAFAASDERVPRDVDASNQANWWTPMVVSGGNTYVAFDSPPADNNIPNHEVKIGKRDSAGNWTFNVLKNPNGTTWTFNDDIGHHQPTMAVDGEGYLHVWADMHGELDSQLPGTPNYGWRYWRSDAPGSLNLVRRNDMPGNGLFTYPVAKTDANGNVWLMIRNRQGSDGTGELYRWNPNIGTPGSWTKVANFAANDDAVVYPDDIAIGSDGSVHLLWEWAKSSPRSLRHYGSYLRYAPGTNSFTYADGTAATVPVNLTNSKLFYLPLQAGETFTTSTTAIGLQAAKMALDANNRPTIGFRFRPTANSGDLDFDVMRIRWNGSAWVDKEIAFAATNNSYAAINITRTTDRVRLYYATSQNYLQQAVKVAGTTGWTINSPAPGRAITRLSVVPTGSSSDRIYGVAPTDINANTGSLYLVNVTD